MLPFSLDVCIFHFYSVSAVFILESNDVNVYIHASSIFQWSCEVLIDSLEKIKIFDPHLHSSLSCSASENDPMLM